MNQLTEHPEFREAQARLDDLQTRIEFADAELREAEETRFQIGEPAMRRQREAEEADALLAESAVAVAEAPPSIAELSHNVRVLTLARDKQRRIVDALAERIEREHAPEARPAADAKAREIYAALLRLQQLTRDYDELLRARRKQFHGYCSLPVLTLRDNFARLLTGEIAQYLERADIYKIDLLKGQKRG